MSSSRNPSPDNDAPRNSAPPAPQPVQTEQNEQVARTSNPADSSAPPPNEQQQSDTTTSQNRTKAEGSCYAGSYRLPDVQQHHSTSSESHFDFDANLPLDNEAASPDEPPPAYTELPGQISNQGLGTNAVVAEDGRVNIHIDQKSRALTQLIFPQLQRQLTQSQDDPAPPPPYVPELLGGAPGQEPPPPLNIVIQVVGSRGDVQPFIALGKVLKDTYGHRVRLATHPTFQNFVMENGLEFFSIGGDPAELMAFMVKNPGLMPGFDTLRSGDVGKRRKGIAEILRGTWRSCIETGNGLGVDPLTQTVEEWMGIEDQLPDQLKKPFVADAIIANPPAFGHIHCAEKLGIPLHMMFTMPWSPTQQFPHPLANIKSSNADATITNYMSYIMVDVLTWQGLGDIINRFRKDSLHLDPISGIWAPAVLARLKIPFTYCWSSALIPKPKDWSHHISVAGFYFLNLASNYTPEPELEAFLSAGEPPVYIGFGSIVVDDPDAMTKMIFDAVKITGKRALVSKGWGGLGANDIGKPDGVFMLGNCPHDWLFKHVSAVVHHGGAGTTAAGIASGKPTVVVPFFGDQPFWGAMVSRAGAGPDPIPYKNLTAEKLAHAINDALRPESLERAQGMCEKIMQENGTQKGAQSFHQMLGYDEMRCAVLPNKLAVWRIKRTQTRLSAKAATILAQQGELDFSELKLFRAREYVPDEGPRGPITGAVGALMGTMNSVMMGVADMPVQTLKMLNIHPDSGSRKGKERAIGDTTPSGESSHDDRSGRPIVTRNLSDLSPASDSNAHLASSSSNDLARTHSDDPHIKSSKKSEALTDVSTRVSGESSVSATENLPATYKLGADTQKAGFGESVDSAIDTGKGLARMVGAGFKSPMDFSLGVAKGLHNAPKLYGAEVRQVEKVTDFQSGIKTAAKQFGLGLYDGITGIVTDPYKGAKKEGGIGFIKGVGRGIFSVPFRVMGGAWSVPGYVMKGLYQEMIKSKGKNVQDYIIAARIAQGCDEASSVTQTERDSVVSKWKSVKVNIKKKRNPGAEQIESLYSLVEEKRKRRINRLEHVSSALKRPGSHSSLLPKMSPANVNVETTRPLNDPEPEIRSTIPSWRQQEAERVRAIRRQETNVPSQTTSTHSPETPFIEDEEEEAEQRELEKAIAVSVAEASHGNPEEDSLVETAIRASITELERTPAGTSLSDDEAALKRAVAASLAELGKTDATAQEQAALEETLRKSLLETHHQPRTNSEQASYDGAEADEVLFQRVLAESRESATATAQDTSGDADEDMKKALRESAETEQQRRALREQQMTEEDVVMEYVRKQSLLEEQCRQRRLAGGSTTPPPTYD